MKTYLVIFIALLPFLGYGQPPRSNANSNTQWKTLSNNQYAIQYPANWELNQSGQMGSSFILFSPLESAQDSFKENINLIIQDLAGYNVDLNQYTQISEEQIKTMLQNASILESKRLKNTNGEYQKMVYTATQNNYRLKFLQYYWVAKQKAYILTFTAEQNKYDTYLNTAEKIFNSFKIK